MSDSLLKRVLFYGILILLPFIQDDKDFFPYWSAYFSLGVFYILYLTKKVSIVEYLIISLLSLSVVIFYQGYIDTLIALSTLLIIHFFPLFKSKIGSFLGKISYSLYLLHTLIGSYFIKLMFNKFTLPFEKFIVVLVAITLSIFGSWLYWKLVEKPSQYLAKKIKMN